VAHPLTFLGAIENSGLSTWMRESDSPFGFYFILAAHTIGLAMLVGPNAAIDLRILGVAREIPLLAMRKWFTIMWIGFVINAASGVLLWIAYPTKATTNVDFYIKLLLIGIAVWVLRKIQTQVFGQPTLDEMTLMEKGKTLATLSICLWVGAITAGRLLAYTYSYILYDNYAPGG
jgi:hypothetical protein